MTSTIYTYERHNLGDQLIFLHLLRALAKPRPDTTFVHFCNGCHIGQLMEVVADIPNIILLPFENPLWQEKTDVAICAWKNAGATDTRTGEVSNYQQGFWEKSANRWNWSAFMLEHHAWTAGRMGFESPFSRREHLLFDYPALDTRKTPGEFDILFINSEPCSGQFRAMAEHGSGHLNDLAQKLSAHHRVITTLKVPGIPCTMEHGESISGIGCIARTCRLVAGVATGPWWPCLSTHAHHNGTPHAILLDDPERLNMPNVTQFGTVGEVEKFLWGGGWI